MLVFELIIYFFLFFEWKGYKLDCKFLNLLFCFIFIWVGFGKIILLNIFVGRLFFDDGEIFFNGIKFNRKFKRKICYVL